jgi:hypothetical protein
LLQIDKLAPDSLRHSAHIGRARPPETFDARNERDTSPAARLWISVIHMAVLDAFAKPDADGVLFRKTVEARQWLTSGGRDLRDVCEFASQSADKLHVWGLEMEREQWPLHRLNDFKQIARGKKTERIAA